MASIETALGRIGYVESAGAEARAPIVFLHGVGSDKSVWHPQLAHFTGRRRAIAFDYPGYGDSEFRAHATRRDFACSILAAMDSLDIARAHICGLSLGGIIAMEMWDEAPGRCLSLVLADTFARHPDGQGIVERSIAAANAGPMRTLAEARCDFLLHQPADPAVRAEVIETMSLIDPEAYKLGAEAVWNADQRNVAATITCPTLVICGDQDKPTPPALSEDLAERIAIADYAIIERAGHLTNLEKPGPFNRLLDIFLGEVEGDA